MIKATQTMPGMATTDDLFALLEKFDIPTKTHAHPPVRTVQENRSLRGTLPGTHCKTLFFKDKKEFFWLCAMEETLPLNIRTLADLVGSARLSFAKPERVKSKLGVEPGAISPFALINNPQSDINMIFDATLMAAKVVNFHPLVNDRTTAINPNDLVRFLQACGHSPVHIDLNPGTDKIK
ncbi:MAG: prolyl-tRNA synthetase associated domain-containing protein [Pseudomonadota bacterium]|nr:prolyl-tRNA synthetase associated domain-containing protein [Pseudomonadota bacterium]